MKPSHVIIALLLISASASAGFYAGVQRKSPEAARYQFFTTPGAVCRGDTVTGEVWRLDTQANVWVLAVTANRP